MNRIFIGLIAAVAFFSSCNSGKEEIKLIPVKTDKSYQFIDLEGKIKINPQFSYAGLFHDGLALVKTSGENEKYGYISEDGKYVVNPSYIYATNFSEGMAWVVSENGAPVAIDKQGKTVITLKDANHVHNFFEGLAAFSISDTSGEKWGFVDNSGKVVINNQFSSVGRFSEDRCAVRNKDGKYGFIDKQGKIVINYQFDGVEERFINGTAIVKLGDKCGAIDKDGKFTINPQFKSMQNDGDLYLIKSDSKFGWCDKSGKFVINPQFDLAFLFGDAKLAPVQSGKSFGYVDKEGKIVINPQFDAALPFSKNLALVINAKKIGFIDQEGKYIVNPQFDGISNDYVAYLMNDVENYEVETDYINIDAITQRINLNNPEGLIFPSTFGEIKNKLNKSESDFDKYYGSELISNEPISNNVKFNFTVYGTAYEYYYTSYSFMPDNVPTSYNYTLYLSGKAGNKAAQIMKALGNSLKGYEMVSENENYLTYTYRNESTEITIRSYTTFSTMVSIYFTQKSNYNSEVDHVGPSDIEEVYSTEEMPATEEPALEFPQSGGF
jgi:hypothetical protein